MTPVILLKITAWRDPADLPAAVALFAYGYIALAILISVFYLLFQYQSMDKTLAPVTKMAEVGELAAHVAHDLASPLSSIQAALVSFKDMKTSDAKTSNSVRLLELGTKRLKAISQELLDYGKEKKEAPILFPLHDVLDELVSEYEIRPEYKGTEFTKQYCPQSVSLFGDRTKIQRVFGNLVKNAVEAMDGVGSIALRTIATDKTVTVEIEDDGCGMPPEVLANILNGNGTTHGKEEGHGIGLQSVKKILEEHGGHLGAKSEIAVGTTFVVRMPLTNHDSQSTNPDSRYYTVLVIDDDPVIRMGWELMRERLGVATLYYFPSWEEAVQAALDFATIDIAFVDKNIEGSAFSGAEVVDFLKSQQVGKIVLASGENEESLRQDPRFIHADFIVNDKIPKSFKTFFS